MVLLLVGACAPSRWDGDYRHWGTVREVLRFERTQGRVTLTDVAAPSAVGLGALAGLHGEVLVVDGEAWVSRVDGDARPDARLAEEDEEATFLVISEVPQWTVVRVRQDVAPDDLERFLREAAEFAGLDWSRPFPFIVRGTVFSAELHVLNGKCPVAFPDLPPEQQPFRASFGRTPGTLVGFYGEGVEAILTHHGSRVHIHGRLGGDRPIVGHLDAVGIAAGAVLQLPKR
jgi:hypothetical protein